MSSKNSASHEYCQGYADKNGMWNNGFYCRRWGGHYVTYCCGDGQDRFCCPEIPHLITPMADSSTTPKDSFNYIPVIIGICVAVVVVFVAIIIITAALYCPAKKRRRMREQRSSFILNGTLPVCCEAEVTSSVIAAEALQIPFRDHPLCPSPRCGGPSSICSGQSTSLSQGNRHDYGGAVGRPWSPTGSHSTVEDFDSVIISSFYRQQYVPDLSWHPDVQSQLCNCNYKPQLKLEPIPRDVNLPPCSVGNSVSFNRSAVCPSVLGMDSFGDKKSYTSDDEDKQTTHPLSRQVASPFRTPGVLVTSSSQGRTQPYFRFPAALMAEAERHKRDSGVLVEDQDTKSDNSGSPFSVGLASDDKLTTVRTPAPRAENFTWNIGS